MRFAVSRYGRGRLSDEVGVAVLVRVRVVKVGGILVVLALPPPMALASCSITSPATSSTSGHLALLKQLFPVLAGAYTISSAEGGLSMFDQVRPPEPILLPPPIRPPPEMLPGDGTSGLSFGMLAGLGITPLLMYCDKLNGSANVVLVVKTSKASAGGSESISRGVLTS